MNMNTVTAPTTFGKSECRDSDEKLLKKILTASNSST